MYTAPPTVPGMPVPNSRPSSPLPAVTLARSEEHTSELQSHSDLHSFPTRRSSDLAAVGPGVHVHRSPYRPRNAGSKLEAFEPFARGHVGEHRVQDTGVGNHARVIYLHAAERAGGPQG